MARFIWAGMIAASIQAVIIGLTTAAMLWQMGDMALTSTAALESIGTNAKGAATNISWIYLLISILVSLVRTPSVYLTASNLKLGFRSVSPTNPEWAANTLLVSLVLTAIGCGILAVEEPPATFLKLGLHLGSAGYGHTAWAAIMSVAAAGFGANSHAVLIARG